jgi:hypothetical protein
MQKCDELNRFLRMPRWIDTIAGYTVGRADQKWACLTCYSIPIAADGGPLFPVRDRRAHRRRVETIVGVK